MIKKHTQNNVDEPGPQLVVEPPPQGQFPLSGLGNKSTHLPRVSHDHPQQSFTKTNYYKLHSFSFIVQGPVVRQRKLYRVP